MERLIHSIENKALFAAAIFTLVAAIFHLMCIAFGGKWYLVMGAGKEMARLADSGHWYPTVVTLFITLVLTIWSAYALSGARLLPRLPFLKPVLLLVSIVFLARGFGFLFMKPYFPGNSDTFWMVSSGICFVMGVSYSVGTWQIWKATS